MTTLNINLGSGSSSSTSISTVYTTQVGRTAVIYSLTLTNTSANIVQVDVFVSDGTDRILERVNIPAGNGKVVSVRSIKGVTLSANQSIKIQAGSSDTINFKLNGAERT